MCRYLAIVSCALSFLFWFVAPGPSAASGREHGRDHDWNDDDARCHEPPTPPAACDAKLDFTFADFQRRGPQAPTTLRVFAGNEEVLPSSGVYSVALRGADGRWIRDPEAVSHRHYTGHWNSANLPQGAYLILRLGHGRVLHGFRGYMGQSSAVYVKATATAVGAIVVGAHNYGPDKYERQGDGMSAPLNASQDEFKRLNATTVVGRTTVTVKGDYLVQRLKCATAGDLCAGVTCAARDQCHDAGTCDPATGACSNPIKSDGTACNADGNACTQNDSCQAGACVPGAPVKCTAQSECHEAGVCDPATGACSNPPKVEGSECTSTGDPCQLKFACDGAGSCVGVEPVVCASRPCSTAVCDSVAGECVYTADDSQTCAGEDACMQAYACHEGMCVGSEPVTCAAPGQCESANTCDPTDGRCKPSTVTDKTECDDGNPCTTGDECLSGVCVGGSAVSCNAGGLCALGTCDPSVGCVYTPVHCDDGNACTADSCDPATGCTATPQTCGANAHSESGCCVCDNGYEGDAQAGCTPIDPCLAATCPRGESCVPRAPAATFEELVSPRATYLRSNDTIAPTIIDLASRGLAPGDLIKLEQVGDFSYVGYPGEGSLLAVFSSSADVLGTSAAHRVPGALAAGPVYDTSFLGNDIPEDFLISRLITRPSLPPSTINGIEVVIPVGATHLMVALMDDYFGDNPYQDDLGVRVTPVAAGAPYACECPPGRAVCDGACVDTQANTDHCGACNNTCTGAGAMCTAGTCGNDCLVSCSNDCKRPSALCVNGVSAELWRGGFLLSAQALDAGSFDNCTTADQLALGIQSLGSGYQFPLTASILFDCDSVGQHAVELWAKDAKGNADFCQTFVDIQDPEGRCSLPCDASCQTCRGPNANECVSCFEGSTLVNGACVAPPSCTDGIQNQNETGIDCGGPCAAACPVDCVVSEFGAWSACSVACGGGTQTRIRTVTTPPGNGGAACPALTETQACNEQPCPVDCVVSEFSAWSACSAECGGGTQTRSRTVITAAANGGTACPALTETQACNDSCPPDQACENGVCVCPAGSGAGGVASGQPSPLASAQFSPWQLAQDATSLYWGTYGGDWGAPARGPAAVRKVAKAGGGSQTLATLTLNDYVSGLGVNASEVVFGASDGVIRKVPVGGGTTTVVRDVGIGIQYLAVDASHVYWTKSVSGVGGVYRMSLAGEAPVALESSATAVCRAGLTMDATHIYWAEDGCGACTTTNGRIMKAPLSGGPAVELASGQGHPAFIAVDGTNVYWTNRCSGTVMKVPLTGGGPIALATGQSEPTGLAVSAGVVYWSNRGDGTVMKVATCGGTPAVLASAQVTPAALLTDGTALYWANYGPDGAILKLGEPAAPDPCSPNPCQNGAVCVSQSGSYTCTCSGYYSGTHCELPGAFTPAGVSVQVLPPSATGQTPASVTFATVTQAGVTTLVPGSTGPTPPVGFALGNPPVYYELSTSAQYTGNITVCVSYAGITFSRENNLRLFHYESGGWVDITTTQDMGNDVLCGVTTSLSPFVVLEPIACASGAPCAAGYACHQGLCTALGTPDGTSTLSCASGTVLVGQSTTCTVTPREAGVPIIAAASAFTVTASPAVGTLGALSPAVGDAFAFSYTAPPFGGLVTLSDGLGHSVVLIVDGDDCALNPCLNGGACVEGVNARTCTCLAGFTGMSCQTPVPVGAWFMNEAGGDVAADSSGNGNDASMQGGPTRQAGVNCRAGGCLSFDGHDDRVVIPYGPVLRFGAGDFTVSAWVRTATGWGERIVVGANRCGIGESWIMSVVNGYAGFATFGGGSTNGYLFSSTFLADDQWHLVVGRRSGATLQLYIDGQLQATGTLAAAFNSDAGGAFITVGNLDGCGGREFIGAIDDVRIYKGAVSSDALSDLVSCSSATCASTSNAVCSCAPPPCSGGTSLCGGQCADVQTDASNCGACGNACAAGETCSGGACHCYYPLSTCGSACVDLAQDENNCGDCGTVCPGDSQCTAGQCACPENQALCANGCKGIATDPANCGACGTVCGNGTVCTNGECRCPEGQSICVGTGTCQPVCGAVQSEQGMQRNEETCVCECPGDSILCNYCEVGGCSLKCLFNTGNVCP